MIHYVIKKVLFRKRWRVYMLGHTEGELFWVATFLRLEDAQAWVRMGGIQARDTA